MLNLIRNEWIAWMAAVATIVHTVAYEMTLYPALTWIIWVPTRGTCALMTFVLAITLHRSRPLPGRLPTAWAVRHIVPITLVWLAFCFLFYFWVGDTAAALVNFTRGIASARANGLIAPDDPLMDPATVAPFVPNTGPVSAYAILFFVGNVCAKGPRHFQKGALTLVVAVVHVVINVFVVPLAVERGQLIAFSCYLASSLASTWSSFKIEYVWRHLFAETRRDQIESEWSCSDLGKVDGFGSFSRLPSAGSCAGLPSAGSTTDASPKSLTRSTAPSSVITDLLSPATAPSSSVTASSAATAAPLINSAPFAPAPLRSMPRVAPTSADHRSCGSSPRSTFRTARPRKQSAPPGLPLPPLVAPFADSDPPPPLAVPDTHLLRSTTAHSSSSARPPKITLARPTPRSFFFAIYDRVLADARANVQAMAAAAYVHDVRATGLIVPDQPALTASQSRMTRARRHAQPAAITDAREALSHTWLYRLLCRFPGRDEAMYQRQRSVPLRLEARYNIILATLSVVAEIVLDWEHSRAMLVEPGYQIEVLRGWTVPCLWIRVVWTAVVQVVDLVVPYLPLVKWNGTRLLLFNTATFVAFVLHANRNPVLSAVQATNLIRQLLFFAVESGVTTQYYLLGTSMIAIPVLLGGLFGPDLVRGPFMSTFMRTLIAQAAGAFVARDVEHMMRQFYLGNNLFAVPSPTGTGSVDGGPPDGGKLRASREGGGVRIVARAR
ncbi:hypothetical protein AMAG_14949 [Allomyces macrogynus ATCC 38327]|uniref:Uncharacterized protein n=1 Tax=Allomyces macrogynus (strain ATCC 38327) TaxID=578462 RepID=A0A0L0T813_ALLM3|nr:hypothetical protein AMAG_14949 [Allomyces macrogynus ATCC 38327]|eukprot:KNE70836.1 hypothetical protein AMAG_14949 [Allomyces macrogynus ATCC 38327]